jgi:hypothetical protein
VIIALVAVIGWQWSAKAGEHQKAIVIWLINMALMLAFTIIAGYIITGVLRGVLIDSRNKISLSRLQMLLWTLLILSGFLTAALINLHRGFDAAPLSIALDERLWALLGISTASLVGSPLIKNSKKSESRNVVQEDKAKEVMAARGVKTENVTAEGKILVNENIEDARWTDIFKGEESGNGAFLDLGKVQMFFFTLITWAVYAAALGAQIQTSVGKKIGEGMKFSAFPDLDTGMVTLLGISHAAYLANKAIPHTPEPTPAQPPAPPPGG